MSRTDQQQPVEAETLHVDETVLSKLMLDPEQWALFLDIDGTLIDLADTPDGIVIPPDLAENLHKVSVRLGGALALVTGRAMFYADQLFPPYTFPIAGLHGAERRDPNGTITRIGMDAAFETLKADLAFEAQQWPGVLIEDKGAAVAAHYRQAPQFQAIVEMAMVRYQDRAGPDFTLQHGKMVLEIRPAHASKGYALRTFLSEPPFEGRLPIAIGDDVTDEAMFRVANELGGYSIRIAEADGGTEATSILPSAADVRAILAAIARAPLQPVQKDIS
ncbi:trehalose-phosphatase [Rhizobium sp. XQZ8]|uniref:trehalose-phosphatase n=1 Tax=Rhizobium populisoli TaxID=2859785 RepID=UPI001CA487A7|nr:trehalose-phosphatase [Rhizobium populisoli]MBW6423394.1 trehalose-phosphatase [Rhizobium populisoli]